MRVTFQFNGEFQEDEQDLRNYATDKISVALKPSKRHVKEVVVSVNNSQHKSHICGNKCSVHLFIPGQYPIQVRKHADNILSAISSAIQTASYKTKIRTRQREIFAV